VFLWYNNTKLKMSASFLCAMTESWSNEHKVDNSPTGIQRRPSSLAPLEYNQYHCESPFYGEISTSSPQYKMWYDHY
jgi:hypothetical protein